MSRISAATCTAGLVAALVMAAPTAAHAQSAVIEDGTADTWSEVYYPETDEVVWEKSDVDINTDVTKAIVKHTARRISVTATYASLRKNDEYNPTYWSWFKLADGREAAMTVWVDEDFDLETYITVEKEPGGKWDKNLECPGLKAQWRWDDDTLTASFPRSCYDTPDWVRFHGTSIGGYADPTPEQVGVWWYDNADDDGPDDNPSGPYTAKLKAA